MQIPQASLVAWLALASSVSANVLPWATGVTGGAAEVKVTVRHMNERFTALSNRIIGINGELAASRDRNDKIQAQLNELAIGTLRQISAAQHELGAKADADRASREERSRRVDEQLSALTGQAGIIVEQVRGLTNTVERLVPRPGGGR